MRLNFVMKRSVFAFASPEDSTSARIFATVDSLNSAVTRSFSTPDMLTQPLSTSSPGITSRGSDSPVNAVVFRLDVPSVTTPSNGIFSPGLTRITSPTCTSSGLTRRVSLPSTRFA